VGNDRQTRTGRDGSVAVEEPVDDLADRAVAADRDDRRRAALQGPAREHDRVPGSFGLEDLDGSGHVGSNGSPRAARAAATGPGVQDRDRADTALPTLRPVPVISNPAAPISS